MVAHLSWKVETCCAQCGQDDTDTFSTKIKFRGPSWYLELVANRAGAAEEMLDTEHVADLMYSSLAKQCVCGSMEFFDNGIVPDACVFEFQSDSALAQANRLCLGCDHWYPRDEKKNVTAAILAANYDQPGCCGKCGRIRVPDPNVLQAIANGDGGDGGGDVIDVEMTCNQNATVT